MWQPQNPICCHYYFIMGPSTPFFFFGFLTLCVFLHLSLTSPLHVTLVLVGASLHGTITLLPFACHIGASWCLPSWYYYFTSFCCCYFPWRCYYCFLSSCCYFPSFRCCYFPWRCYYCFLSSCCYFPSMNCCYFPSCCYYCFFLHCCMVQRANWAKKVAAVLLILATFKTLGQFDIFPFNPYPLFE